MSYSNYRVVFADSTVELAVRVRGFMEDGWEPIGGMSAVVWVDRGNYDEQRTNREYYQALVKK